MAKERSIDIVGPAGRLKVSKKHLQNYKNAGYRLLDVNDPQRIVEEDDAFEVENTETAEDGHNDFENDGEDE